MKNINQSKNKQVNEVFNVVSSKYDLMNDVMSLGVHRVWKKRLIDWINPSKNTKIIDMSAGTGDVTKEFLKRVGYDTEIYCVDPNKKMIDEGRKRLKNFKEVKWICSHAENLPFQENLFDVYVVSFGLRNFNDIEKSLNEAYRVLKPGGRFISLEFSKVQNELLNKIYQAYSKIIPFVGKYLVGKSEPYEYLIKSIDNFYSQNELAEKLKDSGFTDIEFRNLSGGVVAIHSGWKI